MKSNNQREGGKDQVEYLQEVRKGVYIELGTSYSLFEGRTRKDPEELTGQEGVEDEE